MLTKPSSCNGCALATFSQGFMQADGQPLLGVTLLGEALGEHEAKAGKPFVGPAGLRLGKMIERAGYKREQFQILNAVFCRPPNNEEPSQEAIEHCRPNWEPLVTKPETKVIVPMGNVPLFATTGHEGILSKRGYVEWSQKYEAYVLPTVHPSFIMRGNSNWEAAFIYDLRHGVEVAEHGWEPVERDYLLDPGPVEAMQWAQHYCKYWLDRPMSADIETPDKSAAEDEVDINLGFLAGPIYRIGFAYIVDGRTRAMSIPWDANYMPTIKLLFSIVKEVVGCNRHFDFPRILAHNVHIFGEQLDMQESWHVLFSDLPKKLEHIAPYVCPKQPAWKHLSSSQPALYNAYDAAVQIEAWYRIKELLEQNGMWEVYQRDVRALNPILLFMSAKGMPIDVEKRMAASQQLMDLKAINREKLNEVAKEVRPSKVYKKFREGLEEIEVEAEEVYCTECGRARVSQKHPHFKCGTADGEVSLGERATRRVTAKAWVQPLDFKPSPKGLIRYATFMGYKLITRWDRQSGHRKTPMDENAIRQYALKYTEDKVWPLALEERELNKLLGTYTGRLTDTEPKQKDANSEWWEAYRKAQYVQPVNPQDRLPRLVTLPSHEEDDMVPF